MLAGSVTTTALLAASLPASALAAEKSTRPSVDRSGEIVFAAGHSPVPEKESTATSSDGTKISYFEYGRSRGSAPTIVLVHGYPNTHAVFYGLVKKLSAKYHVVSIDTRGSGHSGHPKDKNAYTLDHLDDDFLAVVKKAAPGEKVTYVGHDFGGIIGWDLLRRQDTRALVGRYITLGSPSFEQWSQWFKKRSAPGDQPFGILDIANQMIRIPEFWGFLVPGVPEISWKTGAFEAVVAGFNRSAGEPRESGYSSADGLAQARAYQANFADRIGHPRYKTLNNPPPMISLDATQDRFFSRDFVRSMDVQPGVIHRDVPGGHWGLETDADATATAIESAMTTTKEG